MEFLNVSRQRAAEPSATGRALSKAAGFVTEGGCWQRAGDTAAVALVGSAASPGASSTAGVIPAVFYSSAIQCLLTYDTYRNMPVLM